MTVNVNQVGFDRRLAVVRQLLHGLGLKASNISTLAYDEAYQYPFNNFLFKVELATPASASTFPGTQPGTCRAPQPGGVSALVVKLSNPAAHDVNNANRVANDVAAQHLVRKSMAEAALGPLVPDVYAWAAAAAPASAGDAGDEEEGFKFGWIISECRGGVDLNSEFVSLPPEDRRNVLGQMAAILGAIQAAGLPEGVTRFGGGLKFDPNGDIVSEWRVGKLRSRLELAAESSVIQGWERNGGAGRINRFMAAGGPEKVLAGVDVHRKCLIHGDLSRYNMLFDKKTKRITGVLDFDFASVSHPFEEFIGGMSLTDVGGNISDEDTVITEAMLSGDFTTPPAGLDKESAKEWELARTWDGVLQESAAHAPSQIAGVGGIRDLMRLQWLLCPYWLRSASALEGLDDEERARLLAQAEADLSAWLEQHGF